MAATNAHMKPGARETLRKRHTRKRAHRRGGVRKGLLPAIILILCTALSGAPATAEFIVTADIPQTDPSKAGIEARAVTSKEDALAYAQALWASDYLDQDTSGLSWAVEEDNGVYYVTAGEEAAQLAAHFGADGVLTYLYNGISGFSDARISPDAYTSDPDTLCMYLLDFTDALSPGASDRIEAFDPREEVSFLQDHTFATFAGYVYGKDGGADDTYSLFTVEVSPQVRVVNYAVGIPMSTMNSGIG